MRNERVMTPSQLDAAYESHGERLGTAEPLAHLLPVTANPNSGALKGELDPPVALRNNPPNSGKADNEMQLAAHQNRRSLVSYRQPDLTDTTRRAVSMAGANLPDRLAPNTAAAGSERSVGGGKTLRGTQAERPRELTRVIAQSRKPAGKQVKF